MCPFLHMLLARQKCIICWWCTICRWMTVVVQEMHPGVPHPILCVVFHVSNIKLSINFSCLKVTLLPSHDFCHVGFFSGQCFPKNECGTLEDCPDLAGSLMDTSEFFCM